MSFFPIKIHKPEFYTQVLDKDPLCKNDWCYLKKVFREDLS